MKISKFHFAPIVFLFSLLIGGCLPSQELSVPSLPEEKNGLYAEQIYRIDRIVTGSKSACPLDKEGRLMVFSEKATVSKDGSSLTVSNHTFKLGDSFIGSSFWEVPGGMDCNGVRYPAIHIGLAGVEPYPFPLPTGTSE